MSKSPLQVAVVGSGPAALMAADVISSAGLNVTVFERRPTAGRKLLIAGSSGLNVTFELPLEDFPSRYSGDPNFWKPIFSSFSPNDWLEFIHRLGLKTFKGTSHRYFVEDMKAARLLTLWTEKLSRQNVQWLFDKRCSHFQKSPTGELGLSFDDGTHFTFQAIVFALGGASWEPTHDPVQWPRMFLRKKIGFTPFTASNCGFSIQFKPEFLKEAEGQPLKNVTLTSSKGSQLGDLVVTSYGLEGTPVYAVGAEETVFLDLKPDLSEKDILKKLNRTTENLNPIRRIKKFLKLSPAALALIYHHTSQEDLKDLTQLVQRLKKFPLKFEQRQGLEWAISSAGGIKLEELDSQMALKKFPGVFLAGEMLDWDTVTGGFLIQACVSQGFCAGQGVISYLSNLRQQPKSDSSNQRRNSRTKK
ncbi:MAG: TIGR03862 family flavoprotein [Deltaproteobacteria bacterium]|nr:TIGR03862 family flavoprotein [Deltaproteobacteria bacterium]